MRSAAAGFLLVLMLCAGLAIRLSPSGYAAQDRDQIGMGPTPQHGVGTDDLGRDRGVRVAGALLLGLAGAVFAAGLATSIAVGVGCAAAFTGRRVAACLMYASDLFLTLPWLFLLMMVRASLPLTLAPLRSAIITFVLLGLLGWPVFARVTYAGALRIRDAEWMAYGRGMGLRPSQILLRHTVPHLMPLAVTQFLVCVPACVVAEANLGTLGLGVSEPLPSWGSMLLGLQSSAARAGTAWIYLPIVLLVVVLLAMELMVIEVRDGRT